MLWADGKTLYKKLKTTRLGEGLARTGRLSPEAIERTAAAVAAFFDEGKRAGAVVMAFATAAVRCSENGVRFVDAVRARCGLEVDVVSGEEEANLAVLGALGDRDGGVIDIGGASTEICLRKGGATVFSTSLNLGAVRLYDLCRDRRASLEEEIGRALSVLPAAEDVGRMYAVGGTATTLAALKLGLPSYDADKIQELPMGISEVAALTDRLFAVPADERRSFAGTAPILLRAARSCFWRS